MVKPDAISAYDDMSLKEEFDRVAEGMVMEATEETEINRLLAAGRLDIAITKFEGSPVLEEIIVRAVRGAE